INLDVDVLPVRKHVELLVQQAFQRRETCRIASLTVEIDQILVQEGIDVCAACNQLAETFSCTLKLQPSIGCDVRSVDLAIGQSGKRGDYARVFLVDRRIFSEQRFELIDAVLEYSAVAARCEWEKRLVILNKKLSVHENEFQLLLLQDFSKRTAKNGKQDLAFERSRRRMPIDVEVGGVGGLGSVFQNIHPP